MFQPHRYFTQDTQPAIDSHKYCLPLKPDTQKRLEDYITSHPYYPVRETINNEVDRVVNDMISDAEKNEIS